MFSRLSRAAASAAAVLVTAGVVTAAAPAQAAPGGASAEHKRIVNFWTADKIRAAKTRDFVFNEKTKKFELSAKPIPVKGKPGTGGTTTTGTLGADWLGNGLVQEATGKVFFAMPDGYYVCSATSTKDTATDRTVVTTAGHCIFDNATQSYSSNWMFIPNYDATPVTLNSSGAFCAQTKYGCWTAQSLIASSGFTSQTSFSTQATLNDFAFAVMGPGGKTGTEQLDATVGAQNIAFSTATTGATTYLFGYPAESPYNGTQLKYSAGPLGYDPNNGNQTYRVQSNMTGGCSGGPWFQGFSTTTGAGTQVSVNSYGYPRVNYMHGPKFNAKTQAMYNVANTTAAKGGQAV